MRRFPSLRSGYYFARSCRLAFLDSPQRARAGLEEWYAGRPDPWNYEHAPEERQRYAEALALLDHAGADRVPGGLEVGCGEGLFTAAVAPRCDSLLALDVSEAALARARRRCANLDQAEFRQWDARSDTLVGSYELVLCMDVMDDLHRPWVKRKAMRNVIAAVAPGGLLLVTAVIQHPIEESSRWGRWLGRGGRHIIDAFPRLDASLVADGKASTSSHLIVIYRREAAAS